jgi:hypothetical protein
MSDQEKPLTIRTYETDDGSDGGAIVRGPDTPLVILEVEPDGIRLTGCPEPYYDTLTGTLEIDLFTTDFKASITCGRSETLVFYVTLKDDLPAVEVFPNILNRPALGLVEEYVRQQLTPQLMQALREAINEEEERQRGAKSADQERAE